jgi:hypothetical protein
MSSSSQVRWGALGALLTAAVWTVSGIIAFAFGVAPFGHVGSLTWYLIGSSDAIAQAGMLVALVGLHVRQVQNFVGTASFFLATVIWLLTAYPVGEGAILDILEYVSLFGLLVGFPLLGVATFRARVLPRWCGVLLVALPAVFLLVFSLLEYSGAARALFGPYWLALGYALWSERGAPIRQPSPVN